MLQLGLVYVIQADREREVESAVRRRRLLRPQDGPSEPDPQAPRRATGGRTVAAPMRPTGG